MNDYLRDTRIDHWLKDPCIVFGHVVSVGLPLSTRLAAPTFIPTTLPASGKNVHIEIPVAAPLLAGWLILSEPPDRKSRESESHAVDRLA